MHFFKNMLVLIISLLVIPAWAQDKLIFAVDVIRHGDRTPTEVIPKAPHDFAEGLGQLTAEGMRQEFELGVKFRKKYILEQKLLPATYVASSVYVRSSDVDRTLMSAESLLMGLYPVGPEALPNRYQPIPIHTVPQKQDNLLIPDRDPAETMALLNKYVFTRKDWQEKTAELKQAFALWSQLTGFTVTNLVQMVKLMDAVFIYQKHQIDLPPELTKNEIEKILDAGRFALTTAFKPKEIGEAKGKDLLTAITNYIQASLRQENKLKYVLFSAHDTTLLSIMSAMGVPLNEIPSYASDLNFSLFARANGNHYIKITFNDKPVNIAECGGSTCSLEQFISLTERIQSKRIAA